VAHAASLGSRVVAIAAFVAGAAVGAAIYAALSKPSAPAVVYVDRPLLLGLSPPIPPSAPASSIAGAASPVLPGSAGKAGPLSSPATASASTLSQLEAERALLDEARAALLHGDPAESLQRLARHRRAFANPRLGEERDAMCVEALVKAGRSSEARAQAAAFHRRWPSSLFSATVDSALASIP
jgi:hypothetical protein